MPSLLCEYLKESLRDRDEKVYLLEGKIDRLQRELIKMKIKNHCLSDEPENLTKSIAWIKDEQQTTLKRVRDLKKNSRRLKREFDEVDDKVVEFRRHVKYMRQPKQFLLEYNSLDEVESVRKVEAKAIEQMIADIRRKNNRIYNNLRGLSAVYLEKYFSKIE